MNSGAQLNSRSDNEAFDSLYTTKRVTTPPDGVADNHPPDPQSRNTLRGGVELHQGELDPSTVRLMIVIGDGYAIGPNGVLRDGTAGRCDPGRVGAKARKARGKVHQTLGGAIKN